MGCPPYYHRLSEQHCYFPKCPLLNFEEAKEFCEAQNGSVAYMNSIHEAQIVLDWLKSQGLAHINFWNGVIETRDLKNHEKLSMDSNIPYQCEMYNGDVHCQRPDAALAVCEAEVIQYDERIIFTDQKLVVIGGGVPKGVWFNGSNQINQLSNILTILISVTSINIDDLSTTIVDLSGNVSYNCYRNPPIPQNPLGVQGMKATFIGGRILACGGDIAFDSYPRGTDACYTLTSDFKWQREPFNMSTPRVRAGDLKLNKNQWLITGGTTWKEPTEGENGLEVGHRSFTAASEMYEEDKKAFKPMPDQPKVISELDMGTQCRTVRRTRNLTEA